MTLCLSVPRRGFMSMAALAALAVTSCSPTGPDTQVVLTGGVVDAESGDGLVSAVVRIASLEPDAIAQTDENGEYTFDLTIETATDLTLTASKEGYVSDSQIVIAIPGRDVSVPNMELGREEGAIGPSSGPRSLVLSSISAETMLVKESGGVENLDLVFEVRDSAGQPLDLLSAVDVSFRFGARPGGGEDLFPTTARSNANGRVKTSLQSGTVAGVVQVVAEIQHNGTTISSRPVSIAIHGGLPDQNHFGMGVDRFNMPFVKLGFTNTVRAIVGDKYGNIATPGSAIYFSTTGGIIEGSATTNNQGSASVQLFSNNPYPSHAVYGPGYARVRAFTADENDATIQTEALVLMSGDAQISGISPATIAIPNGGAQSFTFVVSDQNGNPLTQGTSISVVSGNEAVTVGGNVAVTLPDALFGGPGLTEFTFTASDTDPATSTPIDVQITISTSGNNGTTQAIISGTSN